MNLATSVMLLTTFTMLSTGMELLSNCEAHVYIQLVWVHLHVVWGGGGRRVRRVQNLQEETYFNNLYCSAVLTLRLVALVHRKINLVKCFVLKSLLDWLHIAKTSGKKMNRNLHLPSM